MDRFTLPLREIAAAALSILACGAASANPAEPVDALIAKGDAHDRQFQSAKALEAYQQALVARPGSAELQRKIAKQYVEMVIDERSHAGQVKLAEAGYASALKARALAPDDPEVRLTVGITAARLAFHIYNPRRKLELSRVARDEAAQAMKLNPRYALAWHMMGRWHYEMAGLNPVLHVLAETIYGKLPDADYSQAIAHLRKAAELEPGRALFHAELGRAYLAAGRKDEARQELQKSLSLPRPNRDDAAAQQRAKAALQSL